MLVEFSVGNYLSFKDRQTLSLVASSDTSHAGNTFAAEGVRELSLLKSVAVYGANAAGKSNLIRATRVMDRLVRQSATKLGPDEPMGVVPFRLDRDCTKQPSEFEAIFVQDGERYAYGFTVTNDRVHEEWLSAARSGSRTRPRMLFRRMGDEITFGPSWQGDRDSLRKATRPNALFVSVAAQFNNPSAMPVFRWFTDRVRHLADRPERRGEMAFTLDVLKGDPALAEQFASFLKTADLGIDRLSIETVPLKESDMWDEVPQELREAYLRAFGSSQEGSNGMPQVDQARVVRRGRNGEETLFSLYREESAGTQHFFALGGPLFSVLSSDCVLFVDELEASLHPLLTRYLVSVMHRVSSGAQFVFTTHDSTLLDPGTFRRDQIWFVEKNREGATELYSMWDYRPRKTENYQRGYLQGRYGAVPFIGEWGFDDAKTQATRGHQASVAKAAD